MELFRITTANRAGDRYGSGYAARWNSKGKFTIYTATTRVLACLENLVHRSGEGFNRNFKITVISVPESVSLSQVDENQLPENWHKTSDQAVCRDIGDQWIELSSSLLLRVPSAIIRDENNVLINPNHSDFSKLNMAEIVDFEFDERL